MNIESSQWDAISELKPARLSGVEFAEHEVRGEPWLFVHNNVTGQHARINALARHVVNALDANASVDTLVENIAGDVDMEEKEAVASSLIALSQLGMIGLCDAHSNIRIQHRVKELVSQNKANWQNPLAIRIPLVDPNEWLNTIAIRFKPLLSRWLLWTVMSFLIVAVGIAILNSAAIVSQISVVASTPQQWWQFLLVYPLLKGAHELAHALTIKRFGGSIHEAGITVLVLMPVPYVDATDIWRFESRYQRMLVSAAGMIAEGVIASIGFLIWLTVEPGLLANLGFAAALTGSVTTLVLNANPLLKFDGYQILQDALDMPNLAPRASRYLTYLCRRYLFGVKSLQSPATGIGERRWLLSYGVSAGLYRWVITLAIALYLASRYPVLGGMLAAYALYQLGVKPCYRAAHYLGFSAELKSSRKRAFVTTSGLLAAIAGIVFLVPVPTNTRTEGVIDVPHQAQLFAPQTGELAEVFVSQGDEVEMGQPILRVNDPFLSTQVEVLTSELDVLDLEYRAALINKPISAPSLRRDIKDTRAALNQLTQSLSDLVIRASVPGVVSLNTEFSRVGGYIKAGSALGHVVDPKDLRVKAVVRQRDIARVEEGVRSVNIRLAERFGESLVGVLSRQTPVANRELPSQALASRGYGGIPVASSDNQSWETVDPVFHLEFDLPENTSAVGIGGRAFITLEHEPESIGKRSWRALRRVLIDQLAL
ncbi:HlyD family efflux transporter periplasmic adaptor subunit [Granulosicoccus sp.]|nr:HlyD family efflux transporter periplasmic adaptor subunit [Granulosicoccus sp.]MDB4223156.1 HlyD family efflux transporter periplasmic adaptor subunit [Granulosicoccus sp.]